MYGEQRFLGSLEAVIMRRDGSVEQVEFKPLLWREKLYLDTRAFFRRILRRLA